jgi:hypothetical protein
MEPSESVQFPDKLRDAGLVGSVRQEVTRQGVEESRFGEQCSYRFSNKSAQFGRGRFDLIQK